MRADDSTSAIETMEPPTDDALDAARQNFLAGRLAQAERICRKILGTTPRRHEAYRILGLIAFRVGRYVEAVALIERAIELAPGVAEYHDNLAAVCNVAGDFGKAEVAGRAAVDLDPALGEAHNHLGIALHAQGRFAESRDALLAASSLRPGSAEVHNNLGNAYKSLGQYERSAAAYRQALELNPDYAEAHNNLGTVLRIQGLRAEARRSFDQAVRLKPTYAEARRNASAIDDLLEVEANAPAAAAIFDETPRAASPLPVRIPPKLVRRIADAAGCSRRDAQRVLESILARIADELLSAQVCAVRDFGTFKIVPPSPQTPGNPRTADSAHATVAFAPSKRLVDRIPKKMEPRMNADERG